jgi:TatA/E family protein of Tat protein translocase
MTMFGLGFGETILIFAVILLFFGPKRVPEAAQSLGKGIREFRRAMNGFTEELMAPQDSVPVAPPPHATLAGTGADPHALANDEPPVTVTMAEPATPVEAPAPPAEPVASTPAA